MFRCLLLFYFTLVFYYIQQNHSFSLLQHKRLPAAFFPLRTTPYDLLIYPLLTRIILINWSTLLDAIRTSLRPKIIQLILRIFAFLSEFDRFFKNSQNKKLRVMCATTFEGIAMHGKVFVAFKSQKFVFFQRSKSALLNPSKNVNFCNLKPATTFPCIAIPAKVVAHIA